MKLSQNSSGNFYPRITFISTTFKVSLLTVSTSNLSAFNINSKYTFQKEKETIPEKFSYRVNKEWSILKGKQSPVDCYHKIVESTKGSLVMTTTSKKNNENIDVRQWHAGGNYPVILERI